MPWLSFFAGIGLLGTLVFGDHACWLGENPWHPWKEKPWRWWG